jgi:hypothetical protein
MISESSKKYLTTDLLKVLKKKERISLFETTKSINDKLTQLNEILSALARGELSTAQKARLTEITYGHKFTAVRFVYHMKQKQIFAISICIGVN